MPSPALLLAAFAPDGTTTFTPADPAAAHLRVDDLGATRGDGVFESVGVVGGNPQSLRHHLDRFARSAAALDLPAPDAGAWAGAVRAVAAAHDPVPELLVKLVLTRGVEGGGVPTGWAHAFVPVDHARERTEGIDVLVLDRAYPGDVAARAPWLLQGAKTLSYALNTAALRHARAHGAHDVVFLSDDGEVLEGPNSTVVARFGDRWVTPPPELGILDGTTQGRAFGFAAARGERTEVARLRRADLDTADALWLVSSGRLSAPVRSVDGAPRPVDAALSADLLHHLLTVHD
ncbi:aminodeoxychorismate lyase [Kineococcus radiotolerans]|uniref:Branched-chain amino acid aminotransferase n=1 Tax=Kineococcus radiotolerans (strain ATCC BAA-149 / DSM 14245 / SRS30216) TaxID=266940 RepID=A6WFF6_KINRD|nr:aminodeoxychorismate lyase [Kineococcus radiotolerans]ABS05545.1 branched-chain amino acid aminotransferase [Kineococcus radiotolerans SRS30216 = ATCC BAA-149]